MIYLLKIKRTRHFEILNTNRSKRYCFSLFWFCFDIILFVFFCFEEKEQLMHNSIYHSMYREKKQIFCLLFWREKKEKILLNVYLPMIKIETNANCERNRRKYIKSETKVEKKKTNTTATIYIRFFWHFRKHIYDQGFTILIDAHEISTKKKKRNYNG